VIKDGIICGLAPGVFPNKDVSVKILIIEDDVSLAGFVERGLANEGHKVEHVSDGREGLLAATAQPFDVIVVDRMLPGLDGLTLVKMLRASEILTPVLFLTSMSGIDDKVVGLKAGADDYLVKPFAISELCARIEALGRRPAGRGEVTILRVHNLEMHLVERTVMRSGIRIDLVSKEFDLLECLMRNAGKVVTRTMLLERVWDLDFDPMTSVVETHVSRLRAKIDKPFNEPLIRTIRGLGYSLNAPQ
jgi:two-component system, OmpR family, response regulator